ncbi:MAG: tetratricopeptide repeat protein, partial [Acidimicrobiales bacterium]
MAHPGGADVRQDRRRRADQALAGVDDHAADAAVAASAVCAEAEADGDRAADAVAWQAIGIVRRNMGDLDGAREALDRALVAAADAGEPESEARIRTSLVGVHLQSGRLDEARAAAEAAAAVATGIQVARLAAQVALVEERCGRFAEALAQYDRAEAVLEVAGDCHGVGLV